MPVSEHRNAVLAERFEPQRGGFACHRVEQLLFEQLEPADLLAGRFMDCDRADNANIARQVVLVRAGASAAR